MRIRVFIALILNKEIIKELNEFRKSIYPDDGITKWENEEKLHLTLKFLGDIESDQLNQIEQNLENILSDNNKIEIQFTKFNLIERNSVPKIFLGSIQRTKHLEKLFLNIDDSLNEMGFRKKKRKFNPHVTLLRIKRNTDISKLKLLLNSEMNLNTTYVNEVALIKSELFPNGSVYTILKSFWLK